MFSKGGAKMEQNTIVVNKLPTRTWNWLNVNESKISWDESATTELESESYVTADENHAPVKIIIDGDGEYSRKKIAIEASKGQSITVFENFRASNNLAVETSLECHEDASIRLIQIQSTKSDSLLYTAVKGQCEKGGRIEIVQIFTGKGDIYSDNLVDLNGDESGFKADIGYIGQHSQTIDINMVVNHFGKRTESEINASGTLKDEAKKVFRGTIDFKKGSSDSVGNEKETVLMLGDDVINKTIPLILCAEENVVGNHGATIGELDEATLFYFESRGIDRVTAENMLARAAIERLAREIGDHDFEEQIINELNGEL